MKRLLLSFGLRVFSALASAVILAMLVVSAVHSMQDRDEVAKMTKAMKTVCVGRFLIDVPTDAQLSLSRGAIAGFNITTDAAETESSFIARVAKREAEINKERNQSGLKNMESVQEIKEDGQIGKIFVFGRNSTHGYHDEEKIVVTSVSVNGYVRTGGVSFDFTTNAYDPATVGNLRKIIRQLRQRADDEIPPEPGFCINRGIIREPLTAEQTERLVMFAGLPGHADIAIAFSTMAGTKSGEGLLARNSEANAELPAVIRALISTLRNGPRKINGLLGEELVHKVRELNFATTYGFDWEMSGTENDVLAPFLTLELQAGLNPRAGGKPVQSTLSEEALVELWDKISSSIRIRPSAPPAAEMPAPSTLPRGSYASAGDTCPQTGWWRCNEGGNGIGVLGGQLQYLKKGQRMPQALLLPPQTVWQKVRGLQPHYESGTPTVWKLVDKRSHPRGASPVPLAQADTLMAAHSGTQLRVVQVGTVAKTGEPCPASGWWRCEELQALDRTRWFAHGSLLPAATFQVPPGVFGKNSRAPTVIQRRSAWQLVRHAQAPETPKAGNGLADVSNATDANADGPSAEPDSPKSSA